MLAHVTTIPLQTLTVLRKGDRSGAIVNILSEVPQGSSLSRTLFSMFMLYYPGTLRAKVPVRFRGEMTADTEWDVSIFDDDVKNFNKN